MKQAYILPVAIILAGVIVALAVFVVRGGGSDVPVEADITALRPVSPEEHLIGNPTAPVILIEYSDIDCAYCKQMQRTMTQIMLDYGATGKVAWVYRHFPVVQNHPHAGTHAEASECVTSLAGKDAFWRFIDLMQTNAPGTAEFNPNDYPALLSQLGIDQGAFDSCLNNGTFVKRVEADLANGLAIGATVTPYSVIVIKGAEPIPVSGAVPYAAMKEIIEEALSRVVE